MSGYVWLSAYTAAQRATGERRAAQFLQHYRAADQAGADSVLTECNNDPDGTAISVMLVVISAYASNSLDLLYDPAGVDELLRLQALEHAYQEETE